MPAITNISATPYSVALKAALTWGSGHELARLDHVLVRVDLADGAYGIAEATPRPSIYGETPASIEAIVQDYFAPMLLGKELVDFASVAALSQGLARIKNNNTAKGALDMALHQALACSRGSSLSEHLGAERQRVELSAIVSTGSPAAVMADVDALHQAGVRVYKVKIGKDIPSETTTIRKLLESYPEARFYVDANETLPIADAAAILDKLYDMGVMYCEEALPIQLLRERAALRGACKMPIIADDSTFTLGELRRELDFDSFDILNIKTARTGFSQSRGMLELAAGAGKAVMVGSQASSLLGCLHAAVFAGNAQVNRPSECSFYLKTISKTEADLSLAPAIADGHWDMADVDEALSEMQGRLETLARA